MKSSMTMRSAKSEDTLAKSEAPTGETENESSNTGESDAQQHRIDVLEGQVRKMALTLDTIPNMLLELQKMIVQKSSAPTLSANLYEQSNHNNNRRSEDYEDDDVTESTLKLSSEPTQSDLIAKFKIVNHFYALFPIVSLPSNFRRYDVLLKFFIDFQRKTAYHAVPNNLKVKILLRMIEGSDEVSEFMRRTVKFKYEHTITSSDIENWDYEELKREFIMIFLDQGSIYIINDVLNSWNSITFSSIRKSIDEYNLMMKYVREINLIFGGETNLKSLSNSYNTFFVRTLTQATHDQVIMYMEINDLGSSRIRDTITSRVKVIYELEYFELTEILMAIESKKEISKSLFPTKINKNQGGYVNQKLFEESPTKSKIIIPCLNHMRGNCTYGERCFKSHDKDVIDLFKKSDEFKKMLEEYNKKKQQV
jgi:hypothetical protein